MVPPLRCVLCVILFYYTINNDYTWYYICSAWFLDIIISTCFTATVISQVMRIREWAGGGGGEGWAEGGGLYTFC